ncbi:response regulator [Paenibacillus spiritus]|uniref:Response regulator n=1 Tax=Paenibacillus spiritus TaxID=2496557 RepID=A0A5J5GB53_9BACL|nr:response regulator [Paenibacillus spiritus]KAA9005336.1 response regulator [Paenibacillus spiritus]
MAMYKVVLADDELMALEGLRLMADWEEEGFEICGMCENGEEALSRILDCRPDLVITDIRMPGMDGLELISRVREAGVCDPLFVILSGYGDFDYARTALRHGVRSYLLKPVMEPEWEATLAKVQRELNERSLRKQQQSRMNELLLSAAIAGSLRGESLEAADKEAAALDRIDEQTPGWRYIHLEGVTEADMQWCRSLELPAGTWFIELYANQAGLASADPDQAGPLARRIHAGLRSRGSRRPVTVGPQVRSWRELAASYAGAADTALRFFFHTDLDGPVDYAQSIPPSFSYDLGSFGIADELMAHVECLREEEAGERMRRLFDRFREERTAPEVVYMVGINLVLRSLEALREMGDSSDLGRDFIALVRSEPKSLHALEESLHAFLLQVMRRIRDHREQDSRHPLTQIERYLQQHFREPLTVKELGEQFFIHPVYLGQAFIKKNGISLLEYVHDLRIEEAKKRLGESEETIRLIAEETGYQHYHHFLKEFEKRTGMKPAAYRQLQQSKG